MNIFGIKSLQTNYIWIILNHTNDCVVIDPGESKIVLRILKKYQLNLIAILLTHYHNDHTDGIYTLTQYFPKIIIYGPTETLEKGTNIIVSEGDNFTIFNKKISVLNLPGHTENHIGFYYNKSCLFCGDTVFSAGCGTVIPKLTIDMYKSLLKIKNFPNNTFIYCGHENTLSNINFAISLLPQKKIFTNYRNHIIKLLKQKKSTLPTTLKIELEINPFFLCHDQDIQQALNVFPKTKEEEWQVFKALRKKKDLF